MLRLNRGAERVRRAREKHKPDELWVGTGYAHAGAPDVAVYVRMAEAQPLAAELISAVLGRALGLPIPKPFIVVINRQDLPRSRLAKRQPTTYAFGCQALGGQDFAQLLQADGDTALQLLLHWQHLVPATVFDEWLANVDRNLGNIVFAAQSLWLIDHADALGGTARNLYALSELTDTAFANKLGDILNCLDHADRHGHLQQAAAWLDSAATLDLSDALALAGLDHWHNRAEQAELLDFVQTRLTTTHALLCNRLGHPQLSLSAPPAAASESPAAVQSSSSAPV